MAKKPYFIPCKAKFECHCHKCGEPIAVGDDIGLRADWAKKKKYYNAQIHLCGYCLENKDCGQAELNSQFRQMFE